MENFHIEGSNERAMPKDEVCNIIADRSAELAVLESKLSSMQATVQNMEGKLDNMLLKHIEILSVFIVVILIIITNVVGIDAFGNIGIRGLARVDIMSVLSALVILAGIKFFILGFKKK